MKNEKDEINYALKEAHEQIEPLDSWQALRNRIDKKIENANTESGFAKKLNGNIIFWRRTAIAAAACLMITTILLIYAAFNNQKKNHIINNYNLLAQNQVMQLSEAFTQVQDLFNQNCPWMIINSTGKGEIGTENQETNIANAKKIIVLRLAVNFPDEKATPQYFDIVTFDNQLVSFDMPVTDNSNMNVTLLASLTKNNKIELQIKTQSNGDLKTNNTVTIADDSFKTLARIKSNGSWININATGQTLSNI